MRACVRALARAWLLGRLLVFAPTSNDTLCALVCVSSTSFVPCEQVHQVLYVCLSASLSVDLPVCPSVRLSVCLFGWLAG